LNPAIGLFQHTQVFELDNLDWNGIISIKFGIGTRKVE